MKIKYILLTILFIIINLDITFSQRSSNISDLEKHKIEDLMKGKQIIPKPMKSEFSEFDMEFSDSLFICL